MHIHSIGSAFSATIARTQNERQISVAANATQQQRTVDATLLDALKQSTYDATGKSRASSCCSLCVKA